MSKIKCNQVNVIEKSRPKKTHGNVWATVSGEELYVTVLITAAKETNPTLAFRRPYRILMKNVPLKNFTNLTV